MLKTLVLTSVLAASAFGVATLPASANIGKGDCEYARTQTTNDGSDRNNFNFNANLIQRCVEQRL